MMVKGLYDQEPGTNSPCYRFTTPSILAAPETALRRKAWEQALAMGVLTSPDGPVFRDAAKWDSEFKTARVHVQWDTERTLRGGALDRLGKLITHCRYGRGGNTPSTMCAAVLLMRLAVHDGQMPRVPLRVAANGSTAGARA